MKCKNCEANLEEDSIFCHSCGEKVGSSEKSRVIEVEKEILDHFEFLGYEVSKLDLDGESLQKYTAIHGNRANLIINSVEGFGISVVTFYNLDEEKVKKNYLAVLEAINRMNNTALLCSFSMAPNNDTFVCGALYQGKYNKKDFVDFLDLFEADLRKRLESENYLKDFSS